MLNNYIWCGMAEKTKKKNSYENYRIFMKMRFIKLRNEIITA